MQEKTSEKPVDDGLWVRRYHPQENSDVRLICLPHAGGSASFYYPMSEAMPPSVDVLALQYPGRQDRRLEPSIANLPDLADALAEVLRPWLDRPVVLFGHSMGASLAFEVARRWERDRDFVAAGLFASGRRAPSRHRQETVHLRDDEGIIAELKELSGTESRLLGDEELLRSVLPALRADYQAAETYTYEPGPRLRCPLISLIGDNDPKCTVDEARSWGDHTEASFDLQIFSGGHFYLARHQSEVVNAISDHVLSLRCD